MTDDFKEKYAELNAALSWGTTCLNCSNMLTKSYEDYAKREQLEAAVLALRERVLDPRQAVTEGPMISRIKVAGWLERLVSDPTALDRVRQEAVEAALAPIERALLQGGQNDQVRWRDAVNALAAARDAAGRRSGGEG